MTQKGNLVVISGFSGVGKGTVMKSLISRHEGYALSVSCTTRSPRQGEADGREYFFRTTQEFEQMIRENKLIEYAQYVDHYYGTPREYVEQQMAAGKDVILEIDIQGAMNIRKQFPEAVLIFIMPPDWQTLKERLTGRGTETADVIADRLSRAGKEAEGIEQYDYIFVNDIAKECADRIDSLLKGLRNRTSSNEEFIQEIRKQIKADTKGE